MEFRSLAELPITELLSVFNQSFSDYIVPFHLTLEQLKSKTKTEKIDMALSVGVFQSDHLVGFILHAEKIEDGKRIIYNAGTGIIPEFRGQGLVRKMYDFILPVLQDRKANALMLEVIEGNQPAIRAYKNLGFTISRKLLCFKGNIEPSKKHTDILVRGLDRFQWEIFTSFWDIEPSWQSSIMVLEQMGENSIILGAYQENKLVGYVVYNPVAGKVYQIAVHKNDRKKGIGTQLFNVIGQMSEGKTISINNVDDSSESTSAFLNAIGLRNWVSQFEMSCKIQSFKGSNYNENEK